MNNNIAFIDFENTKSTCIQMLGFEVDIVNLSRYLIGDLSCDIVYVYTGVEEGDAESILMYDQIQNENSKIRIVMKPYKKYFKKDKIVNKSCNSCGVENSFNIKMGHDWKANCDVDMTLDITKSLLEKSVNKIYIFTADGDFYPIIKFACEKSNKVYLVSDATKRVVKEFTISRFSTRLRKLLAEKSANLSMINLKDLKFRIEKKKQPYGPAVSNE